MSKTQQETHKKRTYQSPGASTSKNEETKEDNLDRLSQEAYSLAVPAVTQKENVYPYIPISTKLEIPIENKYAGLKPQEVAEFYTRHLGIAQHAPKDFSFYQQILTETRSVIFEPSSRGREIAYSKLTIKRILTPEDWPGDLFNHRPLNYYNPKVFTYIDYIQAWESALYYENTQRKFSWWIQFQLENPQAPFPNWFIHWFQTWGLFPIILPLKVREVYDQFFEVNPSTRHQRLLFTSFYQIPWIVRWEFIISGKSGEKFGESLNTHPWLGRRILIKWWDKYNFFENNLYKTKGIKSFEQPKPQPPPVKKKTAVLSELLKDLISNYSKEELISQLEHITAQPGDKESEDTESEMDVSLEDNHDPFAFMH